MPTQKKDLLTAGTPAITYAGPGLKWKIAKEADIGSATNTIFSTFNNSTLINKGYVFSFGGFAAGFTGDNTKVVNEKSGYINGAVGVYIATPGDDASMMNYGKIVGLTAGVYSQGPGDFKSENYGEIQGYQFGMYVIGANPGSKPGPVVENHNLIRGELFGLGIGVNPGLKSKVINGKDGTIEGSTMDHPTMPGFAVQNIGGKLVLTNKGKIKGDIVGHVDQDNITNKGEIKGETYLGAGDDKFNNKNGKAGALHGDDGNDKFTLGSAKEKIVFDFALSAGNVDRVKNFESGKDKFCLDMSVFGSLTGPGGLVGSEFRKGSSAVDADDHIIYKKGTGELFYDPDGVGGANHTLFALLDPGTKLKADDFTVVA